MRYNYSPAIYFMIEKLLNAPPTIIHFSGGSKPWSPDFPQDSEFLIEAKKLYEKYAAIES